MRHNLIKRRISRLMAFVLIFLMTAQPFSNAYIFADEDYEATEEQAEQGQPVAVEEEAAEAQEPAGEETSAVEEAAPPVEEDSSAQAEEAAGDGETVYVVTIIIKNKTGPSSESNLTIHLNVVSGNRISETEVRNTFNQDYSSYANNGNYDLSGLFNNSGESDSFGFDNGRVNGPVTLYTTLTRYYTVVFMDEKTPTSSAYQTFDHVPEYSMITPFSDPIWTKHDFTGWKYQDNSSFSFADKITGNKNIHATWIDVFNVAFYDGYQGKLKEVSVSSGGTVISKDIPNPTRAGASFKRWYVAPSEETWNPSDPVVNDLNIIAEWDIHSYSVSFNFDTITGDPSFVLPVGQEKYTWPGLITYGTTLTLASDFPSPPTVSGFTFNYWCTDEQTSSRIYSSTVKITENTNYYAKWEKNSYTVRFETDGGSSITSKSIYYMDTVTRPADPEKEGYDFVNWYKDESFNSLFGFGTDKITKNTIIYAKWKKKEFKVSINDISGNVGSVQTVSYLDLVVKPSTPTDTDGYLFDGWFSDSACKNEYDFSTPVTRNMFIYEGWTKAYTVSFNKNFDDGGAKIVSDSKVREDHLIEGTDIPDDPEREGWDFTGWYTASGCETAWDFDTDTVDSCMTLYAGWKIKEFNVSFETRGGTTISSQTVSFGQLVKKPSKDPEKTGNTFIKWLDNPDPDSDSSWNFNTRKVSEDVIIYAKWERNTYTVSFDTTEHKNEVTISSQSVKYQDKLDRSKASAEYGANNEYTITGWYKEPALINEWRFDTDVVTVSMNLYAKWQLKRFDVIFYDGSKIVTSQNIIYGRKATEAAPPTNPGYIFKGWYESGQSVSFDFSTPITSTTKLYTKWEQGPIRTITATAGKGGSINPSGTKKILYDGEQKYTFKADNGYEISALLVDGVKTDFSQGFYTFTGIKENHTIEAQFQKIQVKYYIISANCGSGNGKATPAESTVEAGSDKTIRFIAESGYEIDYLIVDGKKISTSANYYTFNNVNENHLLTVYFKKSSVEPEPPAPEGYVIVRFIVDSQVIRKDTVSKGQTVSKPSVPEKSGLIFMGWYEGNWKWNFSDPVEKDLNLTARFISQTVSSNDPHSGMDKKMDLSNPNDITMVKGQTYNFGPGLWTSSNKQVLTINKKTGVAKAKSPSNVPVTITNTAVNSGTSYKIKVAAPELSAKKLTLGVGSMQKISVLYSGGLNIAWISSNPKVASVDDGTITALAKGKTNIYAYLNGKKYTCKVTVSDKYTAPSSFDNVKEFTLRIDQTLNLKNIAVEGVKPNKLDWRLSDENGSKDIDKSGWLAWDDGIVRVNVNGKLKAKGCGTSTLVGKRGDSRIKIIKVNVDTIPSKTETYINVGKNEKLKYFKVNNKKAVWKATNEGEIVLLGSEPKTMGTVYGLNVGTSIVSCSYNGMEYSTKVHVEDPELSTEDSRIGRTGNNEYLLTIKQGTRFVADMPDVSQKVTWSSKDKKIAFVDENGIIEGRNQGKTQISAKINGTTVKIKVFVTQ